MEVINFSKFIHANNQMKNSTAITIDQHILINLALCIGFWLCKIKL